MVEKIHALKNYFKELFGDTYLNNCFIEVDNREHAIALSANKEGMLLLIEEMITLCELNRIGNHYHLDEAGMANRCNKPMVIYLSNDE
jgi:hypothetical protein